MHSLAFFLFIVIFKMYIPTSNHNSSGYCRDKPRSFGKAEPAIRMTWFTNNLHKFYFHTNKAELSYAVGSIPYFLRSWISRRSENKRRLKHCWLVDGQYARISVATMNQQVLRTMRKMSVVVTSYDDFLKIFQHIQTVSHYQGAMLVVLRYQWSQCESVNEFKKQKID